MKQKLNSTLTTPLLTTLIFSVALTNCAPNSLSSNTMASKTTNGSLGDGGSGPGDGSLNPVTNPLDGIDLKGTVDDQSSLFNGAVGFDLDKTRGEFVVMIPLPSGLMFSPSGAFSKYPDITYGPLFDATGKTRVAVRIPIKYVIKGVSMIPAAKLPSGEALPKMPAGQGELPSLALSFPQNDNMQLSLYIGINAIGLYVSLPDKAALPLPFNLSYPVKNKDKTKNLGYLTYVTAKGSYAPGLFISMGVPANMARILEDYLGL